MVRLTRMAQYHLQRLSLTRQKAPNRAIPISPSDRMLIDLARRALVLLISTHQAVLSEKRVAYHRGLISWTTVAIGILTILVADLANTTITGHLTNLWVMDAMVAWIVIILPGNRWTNPSVVPITGTHVYRESQIGRIVDVAHVAAQRHTLTAWR